MRDELSKERGVRRRAEGLAKEADAEFIAAHGRPHIRKYGSRRLAAKSRRNRIRRRLLRRL